MHLWQVICLCPPAMLPDERRRFLSLFGAQCGDPLHPSMVDPGLSFLTTLKPGEALSVLQERHALMLRLGEWLEEWRARHAEAPEIVQELLLNHIQILLNAEQVWLEHSIHMLKMALLQTDCTSCS